MHKMLWIARYGDTSPATIASMLSAFLWAICLLFPGDTIARPTYRHMGEVAVETTWIGVFLFIGVSQAWRLSVGRKGEGKIGDIINLSIKVIAATVWTYVAIACLIAQYPPAAAMADCIVIAGGCWWDFARYEVTPSKCRRCVVEFECFEYWCPHNHSR